MLDSTTDYIFTVLLEEGRPVATSHSPGCVAVTGYAPADFEADASFWHSIVPEEDRAKVLEFAAKVVAGKSVSPIEHRIVHKRGAVRVVRNITASHKDAKGHVISYDVLYLDATKAQLANERSVA